MGAVPGLTRTQIDSLEQLRVAGSFRNSKWGTAYNTLKSNHTAISHLMMLRTEHGLHIWKCHQTLCSDTDTGRIRDVSGASTRKPEK
jgi:hypothetical protein